MTNIPTIPLVPEFDFENPDVWPKRPHQKESDEALRRIKQCIGKTGTVGDIADAFKIQAEHLRRFPNDLGVIKIGNMLARLAAMAEVELRDLDKPESRRKPLP